MQIVEQVHGELAAHPMPAGGRVVKAWRPKLACASCQVSLHAYNAVIAPPLGYTVQVSGTPGRFFPGWQARPILLSNRAALTYINPRLPPESTLTPIGVHVGPDR